MDKDRLLAETYDFPALARTLHGLGINLAESRREWLSLMMSMAGGGEELLDSFLLLASMGSTYKRRESRREFLKAVRKSKDEALGYLLKRSREAGIELRRFRLEQAPYPAQNRAPDLRHTPLKPLKPFKPLKPLKPFKPLNPLNPLTPPMHPLPSTYLQRCRSNQSTFVQSLIATGLLTHEQTLAAAALYQLGATRDGAVIFWQIDADGQLRDGKVMHYGPDCHRLKEHGAQWVSWLMRFRLRDEQGHPLLPMEWQGERCLFGLQLLGTTPPSGDEGNQVTTSDNDPRPCFIVEAEKTAVILSQRMPEGLWLAAGGEQQLSVEKLRPLVGRRVMLFPDTDPDGHTYAAWLQRAQEAREQLHLDISVSDLLERMASPEQKQRKIDLVDWLMEDTERTEMTEQTEPMPEAADTGQTTAVEPAPSQKLAWMMEKYPAVRTLIETFGLVECDG